GLSPLGPLAVNTMAPDEGNMYLLGHEGSPELKERFLKPMIAGEARSAFFMTEPALEGGAGSDPSMMQTTCKLDGNHWVINGRKAFITGAEGAKVGIVMAKADEGACMFLVDLPDPAIRIEHVPNTIDNSMPGGHATVLIDNLRVPADQMLGQAGEGFKYAQIRLSPARLSHCMRWHGSCQRAHEIATDYANRRMAFGKLLIEHEGGG
ncbi:MAG: acyl-CoA dehydrogenase, partial [Burkholderiales bacterium PBB4]